MSIYESPYAWRFTDEKYALLSERELSALTILPETEAHTLWDRMIHVPVFYESPYIKAVVTRSIPVMISDCGWGNIRQEGVTGNTLAELLTEGQIKLFYSRDHALIIPVKLFLDRWSDFCYPDDANVILAGNRFLIYYEDVLYGFWNLEREENCNG